jgi:hypothetical protein
MSGYDEEHVCLKRIRVASSLRARGRGTGAGSKPLRTAHVLRLTSYVLRLANSSEPCATAEA